MVGLLRVMVPSARERHASSLMPLRLLHNLALDSRGSSLIEYLGSLLKIRILEVAPLVVVLPMVVPPSSAKPVLVLNLI